MPDLWFYGILKFLKKGRGKIQIYFINKGTLVFNLAKIDWSVQIFSDFEFFENFLKII